ncbi:MAG: DJ-1 family glyoxalase III [Verrucomicrobiota bacterium]
MSQSALVILHPGFEEMEAVAPIDILRRGEISVTVASLSTERLVTGKNSVSIQTDALLDEVLDNAFDMLVLPGGPGVNQGLRQDPRVQSMVQQQLAAGRKVAAICAAPLVLLDAGVLTGKAYTAHFTTENELPGRDTTAAVVVDGQITTSQGAGTATAFSLQVLAELTETSTAAKIAESICLQAPQ